MSQTYADFLASKQPQARPSGKEISRTAIHPSLFPFQQDIVQWAVQRGCAATFADTGLGKTRMQLETARLLGEKTLILAPLAVAQQTIAEAAQIDIPVRYVRDSAQARAASEQIVITNYDMLHAFDAEDFGMVVCDESSILKSFTGATKQALIRMFATTRYKLACSATPAPNDHMELGNHADFLGIMPSNEMLSRWFINDTMRAGAYRLKRHAATDFWRWITSWALCCSLPSDIDPSYDDTAYLLPPLVIEPHHVQAASHAHERGVLFDMDGLSATDLWREKRLTAADRCTAAAALVAQKPDVSWLLWCNTNDESTRLAALLPEAVEVRGEQSLDVKEARLQAFRTGAARILITKPDIAGMGLNFQHCADVVFVGLTYSYEQEYQALRRTWRFGQTQPVTAHIITVDAETNVRQALERKHADHAAMQRAMVDATRRFGLARRRQIALSTAYGTVPMQLPPWLATASLSLEHAS
jgi:superfamily II DNA or RNA helicase